MSRRLARITQDEVARMVKAVRSCGLTVSRIRFNGEVVDVIVVENVENAAPAIDEPGATRGPIREPQI